MPESQFPQKQIKRSRPKTFFIGVLIFFTLFLMIYAFFYRAPSEFPSKKIIVLAPGMTLSETGDYLKSEKVIRSTFFFNDIVILFGKERAVISGDYLFDEPLSVFQIAQRVMQGEYGMEPIRVTIPEGTTISSIPALFPETFYNFDQSEFAALSEKKEGYLFPDTYFFMPNVEAENVILRMEDNFIEKTDPLALDVKGFGKPLSQIITMASILEEEARTTETRRTIAGILWKRLSIGMPLQVDSTLTYVVGRNTFELTVDDLKINSPYNSYRFKGLPPTPISNPGMDSIQSALTPIATKYLYFLSDKEGNMHYAVTFAEHVKNKHKYLR